jgi:hypothetical protein
LWYLSMFNGEDPERASHNAIERSEDAEIMVLRPQYRPCVTHDV